MIREDVTPITPAVLPGVAPITLTSAAATKLREVRQQKGLGEEAGLRVFVSGGGCAGLQYGMAFETEDEADDMVFDSEGVRVYVDPVSVMYLQGATIDFTDSLMGGGFKIENPNAVASCGCGHSFRTAGSATGGSCGSGCGP